MKNEPIDLDTLTTLLIKHEGLEPGQTPFRITSPKMKQWKTIHGFPVNAKAKPSKGRENFLYVDPKNVAPAIQAQLGLYHNFSGDYGLNENPTIGDALKVFDQSGYKGKMSFLKKNGVDPTQTIQKALELEQLRKAVLNDL